MTVTKSQIINQCRRHILASTIQSKSERGLPPLLLFNLNSNYSCLEAQINWYIWKTCDVAVTYNQTRSIACIGMYEPDTPTQYRVDVTVL